MKDDLFRDLGNKAWNSSVDAVKQLRQWQGNLFKKTTVLAGTVWDATKKESKETQEAVAILSHMLKGDKVTENEKKFLKEQSIDVVRILPLVAIQGIPVPIPITPLLLMLSKKYHFNILPGDQTELRKLIEEEKKGMPMLTEKTLRAYIAARGVHQADDLINPLLQDIQLIQDGLTSKEYAEAFKQRLPELCESQKVVELLYEYALSR